MPFSYEIDPHPGELGGWRLRLLEDGIEVGGGVFPLVEGAHGADKALKAAFSDAEDEALAWMDSRPTQASP